MKKTVLTLVFVAVAATMFWHVRQAEAQTSRGANTSSPETQQLLAPIASMIDANTFFVGCIDLTRIEPETSAANLKILTAGILTKLRSNPALAESLDEDELVAMTQAFSQGLDVGTRIVQSKLDELRSLGCNEIYLLANSKIMTVSAVQVVFLAPAGNLAQLENVLILPEEMEFGWVFQHDGDKLIANLITPFSTTSMDDVNVGNRVAFQHRLIRPMPVPRPELAAGLERIKNAPVQLVFAPDGVVRGLQQSVPMLATPCTMYDSSDSTLIDYIRVMLATPFTMYDSSAYDSSETMFLMQLYASSVKTFDEGIRWAAIGLDPARPVFAVTIQSKSPEAAQDLHDTFVRQKVMLSAMMASQNHRGYNPYGSYINNNFEQLTSALDFAMLFLPNVQGDRLQLTIDEKRLADTTELITNAYTNVVLPSRESSHKMQCANNMKQIMLALHNYHDANKAFPAPYRVNEDGKPLHSWRVALLPYLEQTVLYEQMFPYMNEPWDSENNKQFHNRIIPQYQCPAAKNAPGMTNYSVVVGKVNTVEEARELGLRSPCSTAFPEPNKWVTLAHMTDGTSNTIAIVERKEPVCWMDPTQEITLEEAIKLYQTEQSKVGSAHKGGFNVALCDGSVQFWEEAKRVVGIWSAALTANGGESISLY